ncbi:helix-turn-helix domain-containing protein [Endozoicomonas arenosclerae]|uniref:helix-turn-helix domain-containing protein n=1 Tax=Endozoicomonas arenosclerae TaxID=1633495 RepID=UPI00078545FB|nr:response regulator transcription factor [Endozoicomonas arenosclerae]
MPDYHIAANFFSLSLAIMCLILVWPHARRNQTAFCFALLQLCLIGHLLTPYLAGHSDSHFLQWLSTSLRTALPATFWLVCNLSFDDNFRLNRRTLVIPALVVIPPTLSTLISYLFGFSYSSTTQWLTTNLPQWLEFLLIAHALTTAVRSMRDDLVEARREIRVWMLSSVGFFIALVVVMEQFFGGGPASFVIAQPILLSLFLMIFYGRLFQFREGVLFPHSIEQKESETSLSQEVTAPVQEDPMVAPLRTIMEEQHFYRTEGITISDLAEELHTQEYRLRKLINQQLGYRNFNDFLNGYRIHEACQRLSKPEESSIPVLTIALDTGFRSLSAFNRAFKERTGITPTQYRKQKPEVPPQPLKNQVLTETEMAD